MNDDLTTQLSRELSDRAGEMDGTVLGLAGVQGRARSIRRRRTATAIVGAAAAVAVIVPTAALATHSGGKPEPAPITHTVTPTPTRSTDGPQEPAAGVLDVADLPSSTAPTVDYVKNGTFHVADGSTYDVGTRHTPTAFVELADGSVVWSTRDEGGNAYVEIRDPDGTYHDPVEVGSGLSVNDAHSIVAWLTRAGQVMIWEGWASQPRPLGDPVPGTDLRLGPVTGSAEATPGKPGPSCAQSGCTVIVNVHDGPGQPWEVSESGSQPLRDGGYLDIRDVSGAGLTIGLTKATDSSTCSKLLGGGEFAGFATCQNQLATFSPDGQLIQAWPGYFDGIGPGGIAVFDLEGHRIFERSATEQVQSYYSGETWEDDTHLLVPTYQDGKWALVRIASDGSMEYAVAPTKGPYDVNPFILPTGGSIPQA